jgi:hypothetical protein
MARKVNTDFTTTTWSFMHDEIERIQNKVGADVNKGLEEATDYLADKLEAATPVETGATKASWVKTIKYKNVKYINNTAVNKKGMPIINILEYSKSKGKPFVRRIVEESKGNIEHIIKKSVEESADNG